VSRIELKCRCGAEAKWDDGCAEHEERIRRLAREWQVAHQDCPYPPAVVQFFPKETLSVTGCVHELEQTTAGSRCRKCGLLVYPVSFTSGVGSPEGAP